MPSRTCVDTQFKIDSMQQVAANTKRDELKLTLSRGRQMRTARQILFHSPTFAFHHVRFAFYLAHGQAVPPPGTPSLLAGLFVAFFRLGVHVGSRIGSVVRRLVGCLPWVLARARGVRFCGVAVGGALRPVFSPSSPKPGWPTIPLHRGGSTRHLGRGGSAHHPAEGAALHHTGSAAGVHAAADTPPLTGRVRRHGCRANSQG